jgi:hypothetical protein
MNDDKKSARPPRPSPMQASKTLCSIPIVTGLAVTVYRKMVVNAHRWPRSFVPLCAPERSLIALPSVVSLGLSEFVRSQVLFRQPAFEVDDDLAGGLFLVRPTDATLDFSPMEVVVSLVPSMQGEVCAEVIARIVGTPDLLIATWKHAREPADQAVFADMTLEVLAAHECCVAGIPIAVRRDTDECLLLDAVVDVNESIAFEANAFAFQLQLNLGTPDVRHLSNRLNFTGTLRGSSSCESGFDRLIIDCRRRTGFDIFFFADVKESFNIFTTIHVLTRRVNIGPRR